MNDRRDRPMNLAPASVMDYRELARKKMPVAHVLRIIREEMKVAMALTGNKRLTDLGPEVLDRDQ